MKKEIKFILFFVILIVLFSFQSLLFHKNIVDSLPEVKLKAKEKNKSLAIMIQNGEDYQEYENNTWPDSDEFIYSKSECVDNNYICFGTNKESECKENIEKYMYRILGVTPNNELYLIKMKGVEEGETNTFQWHFSNSSSVCTGSACEWPNVDIYKRLNGESSNGNPVFINNSRYEYMIEKNPWYEKIEKYNWMYGDVDSSISNTVLNGETVYGAKNNGLIIYDIETGVKLTQHYENIGDSWIYVKHQWNAEKNAEAKIGLMYLHDYYLAYDNELNWRDNANVNNWVFSNNNDNTTDSSEEWLMS